ncbi:MAG: GAF domain-containing sensor histidine kinase [Xanthomonadales bacterium]|nr:GAF domain-containing sensor histidine kinase [Xanthomonadales bacterium]
MTDPSGRAPIPRNESARLAALHSYAILDTAAEGAFDDITRIARMVCGTPIAVVNLIDAERQWFKSEIGLGVRETPLDPSICAHAILQDDLFVVPDTRLDERFRRNPLVTGDPKLRFYAGAPLLTPDGHALGTVCVLDLEPRTLDEAQLATLKALARQVMAQLELRRALLRSERAHEFRNQLLAIVGHDLKSPLRSAAYAIERARAECGEAGVARLDAAAAAIGQIDRDLNQLLVLATSDESRGGPRIERFALAEVLDPLVATWRAAAARKGLELDYVRSSLAVDSHRDLLATIIGNLLSNAVKYTRQGRILIGVRRRGEQASIEVIDTGIGIAEGQREAMFEAFAQVDPASDGLGLGLWIVARSTAMLGHAVDVHARAGGGTRFRITLARA